MIDRTVVLNLARRPDRRASFLAQVDAQDSPWPSGQLVVQHAVDGWALPIPYGWDDGPGSFGCARSHVLALEQALLDGVGTLMVFEDDAVFSPRFAGQLVDLLGGVPPEWDALWLGGQHALPPVPWAGGLVRCTRTHRTHAYLLRRRAMERFYHAAVQATGHIDHTWGAFMNELYVFAPTPFLVGQGQSHSDITLRTDPARWWN